MPRNRTVRLAVLGSSVQRAASSGYPSSRSSAVKRRIVVGVLVLLSLVLITVSFRSSALDGVQGTAATILRPFEVAADRVSRPFRDAVGWARGLVDAKSENEKLHTQIAELRQQLEPRRGRGAGERAAASCAELSRACRRSATSTPCTRRCSSNPQNAIDQSVAITAGSDDGVHVGKSLSPRPVVSSATVDARDA